MSFRALTTFFVITLSSISSTSALYYKRAGGSESSLYAYGTNISGIEVFYGDGELPVSLSLE
jgi:hypothetical protein